MAEIHVQQKKHTSNTWVWILVALLVIAAIVYYVVARNNNNQTAPTVHPDAASQLLPKERPERPRKVRVVIPVVYMRSV